MLGKLGLIMVVVKDMGRSVAFYRDVLGLKLEFESPFWSQLSAGNIEIGLHPESQRVKVAPETGVSIGFHVPDVQQTAAALKAKGVRFLQEPKQEEFGWLAIAADPDGYAIQIGQMPKGQHD